MLNVHHAEYLLVGGYAVAWHGYPRATADLDVWVRTTPDNARRVLAALEAFGCGASAGAGVSELTTPGRILRMGVPPLRIEIQTTASGLTFEACHQRRVDGELDGVPVPVLSLDDLKRNKRAAGRYKDLADLENLP